MVSSGTLAVLQKVSIKQLKLILRVYSILSDSVALLGRKTCNYYSNLANSDTTVLRLISVGLREIICN